MLGIISVHGRNMPHIPLIAASETGSTENFSTSVYENPNIINSSAGHKNHMQYKLYKDILGRKQVQPELLDSVTDKLHQQLAGKNS